MDCDDETSPVLEDAEFPSSGLKTLKNSNTTRWNSTFQMVDSFSQNFGWKSSFIVLISFIYFIFILLCRNYKYWIRLYKQKWFVYFLNGKDYDYRIQRFLKNIYKCNNYFAGPQIPNIKFTNSIFWENEYDVSTTYHHKLTFWTNQITV